MWNKKFVDEDDVRVHRYDSIYGVVTGWNKDWIFVTLDNGQKAFSRFGHLDRGTEVLCTVLDKDTDKKKIFVSVDSVIRKTRNAA